jgi:hypothetical protein
LALSIVTTSLPVRPARSTHPGNLELALSLPGPRIRVGHGAELLEHGGPSVAQAVTRPLA